MAPLILNKFTPLRELYKYKQQFKLDGQGKLLKTWKASDERKELNQAIAKLEEGIKILIGRLHFVRYLYVGDPEDWDSNTTINFTEFSWPDYPDFSLEYDFHATGVDLLSLADIPYFPEKVTNDGENHNNDLQAFLQKTQLEVKEIHFSYFWHLDGVAQALTKNGYKYTRQISGFAGLVHVACKTPDTFVTDEDDGQNGNPWKSISVDAD